MKNNSILFIEMDAHKEFTEVAYSLDGRNNEVIHLGRIPSTKQGLLKLARQFQSKYSHATLHFLYEAGPCGYWMYRLLSQQGHCCYLVGPASSAGDLPPIYLLVDYTKAAYQRQLHLLGSDTNLAFHLPKHVLLVQIHCHQLC